MDTAFYLRLAAIAALAPASRHPALAALHREVYDQYVTSLRPITKTGAACHVPDGRTVNQGVGHIAEWERYAIVSTGELLAGVRWPGLLVHARYFAMNGTEVPFRTNDDLTIGHGSPALAHLAVVPARHTLSEAVSRGSVHRLHCVRKDPSSAARV